MNVCLFSGRLSGDPVLSSVGSKGTAKCVFNIAVRRDGAQEGRQQADFLEIQTWGKGAENCAKYLEKGQSVIVRGALRVDSYTDEQGNRHWHTYVLADQYFGIEFGSKAARNGEAADAPVPNVNNGSYGFTQVETDECPF